MTSLTDLRTQLQEDYTKDPYQGLFNYSMVDRALNKGYFEIQKDLNWAAPTQVDDETFSTVQWTQEYALPSNFIRLETARYNGQKLFEVTLVDLKNMFPVFTQWAPYWYYLYGSNIGLYPIPNTVGTIDMEYYKQCSEVTESQDTVTPSAFDDAICLYAAYKLFSGIEKYDTAEYYKKQYLEEVQTLRLTYQYQDSNTKFRYQRRYPNYTAYPNVLNDTI